MTDQQILEKAIQKAIQGGWKTNRSAEVLADSIINDGTYDQLEPLIFDHDFAKALWGEEDVDLISGKLHKWKEYLPYGVIETAWVRPAWQYHLQMMVIAEDPIKYLGEHLG